MKLEDAAASLPSEDTEILRQFWPKSVETRSWRFENAVVNSSYQSRVAHLYANLRSSSNNPRYWFLHRMPTCQSTLESSGGRPSSLRRVIDVDSRDNCTVLIKCNSREMIFFICRAIMVSLTTLTIRQKFQMSTSMQAKPTAWSESWFLPATPLRSSQQHPWR